MKRSTLFILSFGLFFCAEANHITGGEIFYKLKSQSGNNYTYTSLSNFTGIIFQQVLSLMTLRLLPSLTG